MIALSCHERASIILEESKRRDGGVNSGKSVSSRRLKSNFSIVHTRVREFKINTISNVCEIIPSRKIKCDLLTNNLRNSNGDGKPGIRTISDRYP